MINCIRSSIGVLVLFALVSPSIQLIQLGSCPSVMVKQDFDVQKFTGKWYEIWKNPNVNQIGGSCTKAEYTLNADETIAVKNTQIILGGSEKSIEGTAKVLQSGILGIRFPSVPNAGEAKLYILDTDYENFAVVFTCNDFMNLVNGQTTWILTRDRNPTKESLENAYSAMRVNSIPLRFLRRTTQMNCKN